MFCMSLKRPVLALLLLLLPVLVFATDGKVTKVKDGDTVVIEFTTCTCRLYGIDAPEKKQPHGPEAKDYLKSLIYRQTVDCQIVDTDRYGRVISELLTWRI